MDKDCSRKIIELRKSTGLCDSIIGTLYPDGETRKKRKVKH